MRLMFFSVLLAFVFPTLRVEAWNAVGHRAVAELAWRRLSKEERLAASDLLKQHPHYDLLLASNVPKGVDTNQWAFLTAAVWPDLIKKTRPGLPPRDESLTKYDLYPHAIGYPFVRPADSNYVSVKDFYIAKPNAEMVLSNSLATLNDPKAAAHDRAVSLCWALHLMGDLHQPLHAATWVRRDKKEWDGLGGYYFVLDPGEHPPKKIHLHAFWDQLGGVDPSYRALSALTDRLEMQEQKATSIQKDYQEHKTIAAWVQESYRLAVDFAYAEERVQFAHKDDLASGKVAESAIPVLKEDYINGARAIAYRRMLLAGLRLTDELKRVW